ncbi:MAG: hypothetical protein Ct9H90mP20_6790 [Candidatus Neomarinimicrobiota bacterium]|nr:MAG: hypothetical protein Ct9H90mP20_6790 [Candidatus Neomarinimicrobiota bacterium]
MKFRNLKEKIGIPRNLKEMGITEDLIPNLVLMLKKTQKFNYTKVSNPKEWEELFLEALE